MHAKIETSVPWCGPLSSLDGYFDVMAGQLPEIGNN